MMGTAIVPAYAAGPTLPVGGQFASGSGQINATANQLTINQGTQRGIIDWKTFSVGAGGKVQFNNGSGATLNRVSGSLPSTIAGSINEIGRAHV